MIAAAAEASSFFALTPAASLSAATILPPRCLALPRTLALLLLLLLLPVLLTDALLARGRTFPAAAVVKAATPCPLPADTPALPRPPPPLPSLPRTPGVATAGVAVAAPAAAPAPPLPAAFGGGRIRKPAPPRKNPMSPGRAVGGRRAAGRFDGDFTAPPFLARATEQDAFEATTTIRLSATIFHVATASPTLSVTAAAADTGRATCVGWFTTRGGATSSEGRERVRGVVRLSRGSGCEHKFVLLGRMVYQAFENDERTGIYSTCIVGGVPDIANKSGSGNERPVHGGGKTTNTSNEKQEGTAAL